ncbi:M23 family metallopeptidase [bacterium]|nr:M23 family metallopeptidase [bacterium]
MPRKTPPKTRPARRSTFLLRVFLVVFGAALIYGELRALNWIERRELRSREAEALWVPPPATHVVRGGVLSGEAIGASFERAGIPGVTAGDIIRELRAEGTFDFRRCRPGDPFAARMFDDGSLVRFTYVLDPLRRIVIERGDDGDLFARVDELPTETATVVIEGSITSTFYESILGRGELPRLAGNVVQVFEYDIDFVQDVREGDRWRILLERVTHKDAVVDYGRIFAAEYVGKQAGTVKGYWFDHENKEIAGFYNEKGERLKKFLLRAPLDVLRVTSRFGMRFHPTLKSRRMHTGMDYGAPTGTRVWAVADGVVTHAGRMGGYGNLVAVNHGGLTSRYAHLSKIHVRRGQRVSQRQVIGRVGSTGRSTGPHLHFELLQGGRHINPAKVKVGNPTKIDAKLMPRLREIMAAADARMESTAVLAPDPADNVAAGVTPAASAAEPAS